jgi:hypothetical protein
VENTLGLRDNPFDPYWPGIGRMAGRPLAVDTDPKLDKLVCRELAGLKACEAKLSYALFGDNTATDAPVQRDIILLIVGVRGSGRATLVSLLCSRLLNEARDASDAWWPFALPFSPFQPTIDPQEVGKQFDQLKAQIKKKYSDGRGRALVLIHNLPKLQFDRVLDLFHSFPKLSRVFIVTTEDVSLKERDLDATGMWIEVVERPKVNAQDVRAFIAHRVPGYRTDIALLKNDPELALFPFRAVAAETAVGGNAGSKPLGAVNIWLARQVEERHRQLIERQGLIDLARAPLDELRARLIG